MLQGSGEEEGMIQSHSGLSGKILRNIFELGYEDKGSITGQRMGRRISR